MKLSGENPKQDEALMAEIERIKLTFEKIQRTLHKDQPKTRIDTEASGRFIKNALGLRTTSDSNNANTKSMESEANEFLSKTLK